MAKRIPSLDGLRAVSITLVFAAHLGAAVLGELGVRVFFVISGYLITTLLLAEENRYGAISLKHFYWRRTLRIFPACYVYLGVIACLAIGGSITLQPDDAWHAFTYTTNYHPHRSWWMGHTWSLAVEEQFYLLWPVVLVVVGTRRGPAIALGIVALAPIIRLADWFVMPQWHVMEGESFWTIGDSIAVGCVLAMARPQLQASARWSAFQRSRWFVLVPIGGVLAYLASDRFVLPGLAFGQTATIVAIAACLDWALRFPDGVVGRVLNCRPMVFVGGLSYSLYLWQQPFLDRYSDSVVATFPLNIALAFAAALASYYLIEQPMLRWRDRIEPSVVGRR